ncbi:hypothetical protein [Fluoribacter gormanii]|uniref:Uncharacterized protein n=1 Tax=Fluoribacter gormanii TaxID=464 RepID=A0A377GG23_9GAMM|nr:hypothetical protein [Fluoribacter gormanii]KTD01635.1 hypothetical protein Lgor_2292 [Fluoribacter gormanii]SIR65700.1 hypothetical protein SAMN05421777_11845 [Fluoribacter gormanii]STO23514.1 Uncharacterised protein [Fluoribacter gormanii]
MFILHNKYYPACYMAQEKLKVLQQAKMDEERFMRELFAFLQNRRASILEQ